MNEGFWADKWHDLTYTLEDHSDFHQQVDCAQGWREGGEWDSRIAT